MRPIKLTISGWGPYRDREEIDFAQLYKRGIFLITGQTGAGKTTIFDAVTYALYGDLSGHMRQKNSVRSDFASVSTPTYVELEMEHDGKVYRIRRNPEYQRPGRRKGAKLVTEKENAVLSAEDGWILEGNREVNEKIREILKLDLRQFKQISMIAQGEFAQLLHAGSEEKIRIFREIFGTSVYDLFLKKLKERASQQEKTAAGYQQRMEENVRQFVSEDTRFVELTKTQPYPFREIAGLMQELKQEAFEKAEQLKEQKELLEKQIQQETAKTALAEQINERLQVLSDKKEHYRVLLEQKEKMKELENRCLRMQAAQKVEEAYQKYLQNGQDTVRQKQYLQELTARMEQLICQQEEWKAAAKKEQELENWFAAQEAAQKLSEQSKQKKQALSQAQKSLEEEQKRFLQAEAQMLKEQKEYETLVQRQQYSMIGMVALLVEEGKPCPVCGSIEHPNVAAGYDTADKEQSGELEKRIKAAQKLTEAARKELMKCHGSASAAYKLAEKQKQEWEETHNCWQQETKRCALLREGLGEIDRYLEICPDVESFRRKIRAFHENEAAIREMHQNCQQAQKQLTLLTERARLQMQEKEQIREKLGFLSDEEWQTLLKEELSVEDTLRRVEAYQEEIRLCTEIISHLEEELKGRQREDTSEMRQLLLQKQEQDKELSEQLTKTRMLADNAQRTANSLTENLKKAGEALAVYGIVKDLENLAAGNNARRLVFEQYVLAGYFDEILQAANLRLKSMSAGRYELFRTQQVADGRKKDSLDMEVMDYYTGKRRSVKTLSGGETFKASLALALGLSDVVCAANGGIKVDTLFVDEGFGALDAQSLDQACAALMQLCSQKRLIGIISHVDALKERIPAQIIVKKETDGSSIRTEVS